MAQASLVLRQETQTEQLASGSCFGPNSVLGAAEILGVNWQIDFCLYLSAFRTNNSYFKIT